jgi:Fur family transcriptional regulator, ferric uptake regulator
MTVRFRGIHHRPAPAGLRAGTLEERLRALEQAGYRATPQRKAVLAGLLATGKTHVSADEVRRRARARCSTVNLATTYRTLDLLGRLGMIRRVALGDGRSVFCANPRPHDHGICLGCGAVVDLPREGPGDEAPERDMAASPEGSFAVVGRRIEFYGYCTACRAGAPVAALRP